jgi:uncharacterized protein YcbK (DUF882 family)
MNQQSSTAHRRESTGRTLGLSKRGERVLQVAATTLLLTLGAGWIWSITHVKTAASQTPSGVTRTAATVTSALTNANAPSTAYLTDAAVNAAVERAITSARGASGKLKATIQPPSGRAKIESLPPGTSIRYKKGEEVVSAPTGAGIWNVLLTVGNAVRPVGSLNVISMLPFSAKKNGRVGLYYIGNWPSERGAVGPKKAPAGAYGNPEGFIEVTKENADTPVSEHFKLRDFLTHDQPNVWPKYLVLQQKLIDKLELVLSDLQAHGVDTRGATIMSGFRTPQYNVGGGHTGGRASLSRHMYGDASDLFIDSDHNGQMDDLNHDGRISIDDARVILAAVDRVEAAHPELVGGAGVYTAAPGHGPFIHIDTRGYRARWMGTSGG